MLNLDLYRKLFIHRSDCFAIQFDDGHYEPIRRPLEDFDIEEHLAGEVTYGTYVIEPGSPYQGASSAVGQERRAGGGASGSPPFPSNTVKYICFDLDSPSEQHAEFLVDEVDRFLMKMYNSIEGEILGPGCLMEQSAGPHNGWHAWVFFDQPIPALQVRSNVERHFEWRSGPLDVFPKQDTVEPGGFGNLIRLPLGKHRVTGRWSEFVPVPGWASSLEEVEPLPASMVPLLARPQDAPSLGESAAPLRGRGPTGGGSGGKPTPFPCATEIIEHGLPQGLRDKGLFHFALYCYSHGLPQHLAEEWVLEVNQLCTPPLPEREVRTKVKSAYKGRYRSARCGDDWLRDFCPGRKDGTCKGWEVTKGAPINERFAYLND